MTHSGAIAATMVAVTSGPIRGRPTSNSYGVTSIALSGIFDRNGVLAATRAVIAVAIVRRSSSTTEVPRRRHWPAPGAGRGGLAGQRFLHCRRLASGVVLQFGRYKESTDPGLRWRLPYPIQAHELVNISGVRTIEIGYRGSEKNKVLKEALMLTDDENIINIQFAVQWFLKDPVEYVFNNRHPDDAVMQVAETAIREIVGKNKMDFVLYEGREQVAVNAAKLMQEILDRYKTGILISKVTMQNAQPPEQVQAAFDDAVKASQDRERQKNEGQAYANDVIPKARGTSARLLEEAEGYKKRVIATAEGDAAVSGRSTRNTPRRRK
jgi:HflK protein